MTFVTIGTHPIDPQSAPALALPLIPVSSIPSIPSAPRARWPLRVVQGLVVLGLVGLAVLWGRPVWLTGGVPLDWAGLWTADRVLADDSRFRTRIVGARIIEMDGDAAYQMDGNPAANEYVDLGAWNVGPEWTIAAWVRMEQWPGDPGGWANLAGGAPGERGTAWMLGVHEGRPSVTVGSLKTPIRVSATNPFVRGRWTHVVATGNPQGVQLFVGGELVARQEFSTNAPVPWAPDHHLPFIGSGGQESHCRAQVDDHAVYGRTLGPAEIAALAQSGRGGPTRQWLKVQEWRSRSPWMAAAAAACLGLTWMIPGFRTWQLTRGRQIRAYAAAWMVLLSGTVATVIAARVAKNWITENARHEFESGIQQVRQDIDTYFERLATSMKLIRETVRGTGATALPDWSRTVHESQLMGEFPAMTMAAFATLVRPEARAAHEASWRELHGAHYRIRPDLPASLRNPAQGEITNAFLPITFVKLGETHWLRGVSTADYLGHDLLAVSNAGPASDVIVYKLSVVMGTRIRSVPPEALPIGGPERTVPTGVPIVMPMTWPGSGPDAHQHRGLFLSVISFEGFFAGVFNQRAPDFGVTLALREDGPGVRYPVFDSPTLWPTTAEPATPWFRNRDSLPLYETRLHYDFWTTADFDRRQGRHAPWAIGGVGFFLTLLTTGLLAAQVRGRLREAEISAGLRRSQAELDANRNLLQRMLDHDPAKIYLRDGSGHMLMANRGVAELYNAPVEQVLAAHRAMVVSGQYPPGVLDLIEKDFAVLRSGQISQCEESHTVPDGRQLWFLAVRVPIRAPDGSGQVLGISTEITRLKESEQSLRESQARLEAALRERARLSRDLHDGTIQNLYALGLELGQVRTLLVDDPVRAELELGRTITVLQSAIGELRQFVLALEPDAWQGQSLSSALNALVARLRRTTSIGFELDVDPAVDQLPAKMAIHLLQLVREGLSNVLRHAEATSIRVVLRAPGSATGTAPDGCLEIRDDGKGFDPEVAAASGGRGLRSFRERAAELGGDCTVESDPSHGTRIHITFPGGVNS